uniref:DUF4407 domain-containing protein n=1 Tax=Candidatus Kentrum sp. DK TaxID=2126562 RepID=A0A450SUF0_9GAMM|nr:MAG: hypothetical protein BECKDK2373B_GA0170837_106727 [Candidatus Kentron sp. DK]
MRYIFDVYRGLLGSRKDPSHGIILMAVIGIFFANLYSWLMTANGFLVTKYLPGGIANETFISFLAATLVQAGIFATYLIIPHLKLKDIVKTIPLLVAFLLLVFTSIVFSLVSITYNADSNELVADKKTDIVKTNELILSTSEDIVREYDEYVRTLDKLIADSSAGKDRTGESGCGLNCKGHLRKRESIIEKYNSTLKTMPVFSKIPKDEAGLYDAARTARNNLYSLSKQQTDYAKFREEIKKPHDWLDRRIKEIGEKLGEYFPDRTGQVLTDSNLVFVSIINDVNLLVNKESDHLFAFKFLIVVLPDLVSWVFVLIYWMLLSFGETGKTEVKNKRLARILKAQKIRAGLLKKLEKITSESRYSEGKIHMNTGISLSTDENDLTEDTIKEVKEKLKNK